MVSIRWHLVNELIHYRWIVQSEVDLNHRVVHRCESYLPVIKLVSSVLSDRSMSSSCPGLICYIPKHTIMSIISKGHDDAVDDAPQRSE
jgi:hypothetical protein